MPTPDRAPVGAPCWIELFTSDPDRTTAFYRDLFGWTVAAGSAEHGGYANISKEGQLVAGCMPNDGSDGAPDAWSVYLSTTDAEATAAAVVAHGGQVLVPPMPVLDLGTMVYVADPGGAPVGAWQAGSHRGFEVVAEAGAPAWFELHTRNYEASVAFYRDAFGWDVETASDTPEFRYSTLGDGEEQSAGIMDASAFLPEGVPAAWSIYFGMSDTDATIERAVALGGTVVQPAEDSPFGRLAELADPTGVRFKVVSTP